MCHVDEGPRSKPRLVSRKVYWCVAANGVGVAIKADSVMHARKVFIARLGMRPSEIKYKGLTMCPE